MVNKTNHMSAEFLKGNIIQMVNKTNHMSAEFLKGNITDGE